MKKKKWILGAAFITFFIYVSMPRMVEAGTVQNNEMVRNEENESAAEEVSYLYLISLMIILVAGGTCIVIIDGKNRRK